MKLLISLILSILSTFVYASSDVYQVAWNPIGKTTTTTEQIEPNDSATFVFVSPYVVNNFYRISINSLTNKPINQIVSIVSESTGIEIYHYEGPNQKIWIWSLPNEVYTMYVFGNPANSNMTVTIQPQSHLTIKNNSTEARQREYDRSTFNNPHNGGVPPGQNTAYHE